MPERLGPVGGLAADRPVLATTVIAFGLTALAVLGAAEAPHAAEGIANLILACATVAAAPLMVGAIAPRALLARVGLMVLVALAPFAVRSVPNAQDFIASFAPWPAAAGFAIYAIVLLAIAPLFGAAIRFAFIAAIAALLGMTGALGLFALEGSLEPAAAAAASTVAFAAGALVGIGAVFDFAAQFARGADRNRAAGAAARFAAAPVLFATLACAASFGVQAALAEDPATALKAGLAGGGVVLAATASFMTACAALALRRSSELIAVEENRRHESFRRRWRPLRKALAPSAALAVAAIGAIAALAAGFSTPQPPLNALAIAAAAGGFGGLVFYSIRTGVFIAYGVCVSAFVSDAALGALGRDAAPLDEAAALALASVLAAQLGLCWRDARSPRLNARETTQLAMSEAFSRHVLATLAATSALYAASLTGQWSGGAQAAVYFAMIAFVMIVLAPALMTALTHVVRRDLN